MTTSDDKAADVNDDDSFNSKFHIITIVYDEDEASPKVDLGDLPPQFAITVMQQTVNALFECIEEPDIYFNNEKIYGTYYIDEEEDG